MNNVWGYYDEETHIPYCKANEAYYKDSTPLSSNFTWILINMDEVIPFLLNTEKWFLLDNNSIITNQIKKQILDKL